MESKETSLSIVIPFFNSEGFLKACLDSLLESKGISNVELILVDDGSTDRSSDIADYYSKEHENIKVIHKEHTGAADSRNYGLESATGRYLFFCDSDDMVIPGVLSRLIRETENSDSDVIIWDSDVADGSDKSKSGYYSYSGLIGDGEILTGKEFLDKRLKSFGDYATVIWQGAYRRSYLIDNGKEKKKGLFHEDDLWVPQVILNAGSLSYLQGKLYLYRVRGDSLSNPSADDIPGYIESLLYIYPFLFSFSCECLAGDPFKKRFEANLARKYLHWIFKYDFCRHGYGDRIDKMLLWKASTRFRDKIRVLVLVLKG